MFKSAQEYITLVITRDFVYTALIGVVNKTAEIKLFSEVLLEEGVIEDGVVYNGEGLSKAIRQAVSQLNAKGKAKVWAAIPDNKVIISNSHSIDKLEQKHDTTLEDLSIIKGDNGITAIKQENLDSYINAIQDAGCEVQAIFPFANCLYSSLKNYIDGNSIVLYPFEAHKLKFFIVNEKGVLLNSVMGHNILDKDRNLENGLKEIETYAVSQNIVDEVNKVVSISNTDEDNVAEFIHNYDFEYVDKDQEEIENLPFLAIKGLIKKVNKQQRGFTVDNTDFKKPNTPKITVVAADSPHPTKNNTMKLGIIATVLTVLVLVLVSVLVLALVNSRKDTNNTGNTTTIPTVTTTPTTSVTTSPTVTVTATPTSTPTPTVVALDTVSVIIENGNAIKGDSERVKQILLAKGFQNISTKNAINFDFTSTDVYYKPTAEGAADVVVNSLKDTYQRVTKKPAPAAQSSDLDIILGPKL